MLKQITFCSVLVTLHHFAHGCTPAGEPAPLSSIHFKNEIEMPANQAVLTDNTAATTPSDSVFGELSGLTYDSANNVWYAISDDGSVAANHVPRLYKLKLDIDATHGLTGFEVEDTIYLDSDGTIAGVQPYAVADAADGEGVAYGNAGATNGKLYWLHEGTGVTAAPRIHELNPAASYEDEGHFDFPAHYTPGTGTGCRSGHCMESLALTTDGDHLLAGTEQPLQQDGAIPTSTTGANNRLIWFDVATHAAEHEYVYHLEAIPSGFDSNVLTALTAIDSTHYAAVEVATHTVGTVITHNVRVYTFSLTGATDVHNVSPLPTSFTPVTKTLALTLTEDTYGHLENIQGIAVGPTVGGKQTLVLISDDGLNYPHERTQIILYEY